MGHFNEQSPCSLGVEWRPAHEGVIRMDSLLSPGALRLVSTATETIRYVWMFNAFDTGDVPESYLFEVYEDGDFPDRSLTSIVSRPTSDVAAVNLTKWDGGTSTSNYWQAVDEVTQTPQAGPFGDPVDSDFVYDPNGSLGWAYSFQFTNPETGLAGKHITGLTLAGRFNAFAPFGTTPGSISITPGLLINGTFYNGPEIVRSGKVRGGHLVSYTWLTNPDTLKGWTETAVADFDTGGFSAPYWIVKSTGSPNILPAMLQTWMEVQHAGDDLRVAVATTGTSEIPQGWFRMQLEEPDGTPDWSKLSGTTYRTTFRRATVTDSGQTVAVRFLHGTQGEDTAVNGWERMRVQHTTDVFIPYAADVLDDDVSWGGAIVLERSDGAASGDSQPYAAASNADYTVVDVNHEVRQSFTTPGTLPDTSFEMLTFLVRRGSSTELTDDLTVTVHRTSDNVQMGSSVVVTAVGFDDFIGGDAAARTEWHNYEAHLTAPAVLATSTGYYIRFRSTANEGTGWHVQVLDVASTEVSQTLAPDLPDLTVVTFAGSTGSYLQNGVAATDRDVAVSLLTIPDPPAGFTAASATDGCSSRVVLSWTATSVSGCGGFRHYELQRRDTPTGLWHTIALISDSETTDSFVDVESVPLQQASYRIRVRRVDAATSLWSPTATATAPAVCCGLQFTSNVDPSLTVFAGDVVDGGIRDYEFPQNVTVQQFYGRHYQVAFHELERRGARFKRTVIVAATSGSVDASTPVPDDPGRLSTFDELLAITRPSHGGAVPYVCVRDESGNRWFAAVLTPSASIRQPAGWHTVDVEVVEVTDVPYAPSSQP